MTHTKEVIKLKEAVWVGPDPAGGVRPHGGRGAPAQRGDCKERQREGGHGHRGESSSGTTHFCRLSHNDHGVLSGQLTPVFLPGESRGQRSLVGCSPRGHKESDRLSMHEFHFHLFGKRIQKRIDRLYA